MQECLALHPFYFGVRYLTGEDTAKAALRREMETPYRASTKESASLAIELAEKMPHMERAGSSKSV